MGGGGGGDGGGTGAYRGVNEQGTLLAVYWAQVGFDKKRYRICAAPGTLTLPLVRRGAIGHRVDVHVGLEGAADLDRLEAELLSPKLVVFEAGKSNSPFFRACD
uniref:TPP_enzyme_N domain-containing protein n=1 Tax=Mesocestoides corti TaxID=53468 RepID=A0A5K3G136_MESCO